MAYQYLDSPIGPLTLIEQGGYLTHLLFGQIPQEGKESDTPVLSQTRLELAEYFRRERQVFQVPLAPQGTPFQRLCWQALLQIPYGEIISYGTLAQRIGHPKAFRAVGGANHRNPISILIPCHRVVGVDGSLTGYGGGLAKKEFLLQLERPMYSEKYAIKK